MDATSSKVHDSVCCSCEKRASGAHHCRKCHQICHAIPPCSFPEKGADEGYGSSVLCMECFITEEADVTNDEIQNDDILNEDLLIDDVPNR